MDTYECKKIQRKKNLYMNVALKRLKMFKTNNVI